MSAFWVLGGGGTKPTDCNPWASPEAVSRGADFFLRRSLPSRLLLAIIRVSRTCRRFGPAKTSADVRRRVSRDDRLEPPTVSSSVSRAATRPRVNKLEDRVHAGDVPLGTPRGLGTWRSASTHQAGDGWDGLIEKEVIQ